MSLCRVLYAECRYAESRGTGKIDSWAEFTALEVAVEMKH
jgi:hypothetical protein